MSYINFIFPLDYIVLFISLLVILFSALKGFIQSLLGIMTWIGSILITLYSYNAFSNYLNGQLLKIKFFQNYETFGIILSVITAIPIIFLLSLFVLKRVRKILSSDLDKQIFGLIIDKILGVFYGIIFSYIIFSSLLFALEKINLKNFNIWLIENSEILKNIDDINKIYIYKFLPEEEIDNL